MLGKLEDVPRRIIIFQLLLFVFLTSALASCVSASEVYIETNYKNQPDLSKYGLKDLSFTYGELWKKGQDRKPLPSKDYVIQKVAAKHKNYTGYLLLDIEQWDIWGSDAAVASSVKKLITVLEWVKIGAPKAKVAYYGMVPAPGGYWPSQTPGSTTWKKWQYKNNRMQPLADRVDAIFANYYAHSKNQQGWVKAATGIISEAKRLGKGKPVHLVINPRYHPNSEGGLRFKPIPKDYFALMLETVKKLGANGVVIWGWDLWDKDWNEYTQGPNPKHPWWQATKQFLGSE